MEGRRVTSAGRTRPAGGFTLVELLVVIAILATLIGMVAAMVPIAMRRKQALRAQTLLTKIGTELTLLRNDPDQYGKFPPSRIKDLKIGKTNYGKELGQANDVNTGIECVYFLLNNPDVHANQVVGPGDADLVGNTDDDSYRVARGNASDAFAREYLDPWGNPYVYIHANDYKDPKGITTYRGTDGQAIEVQPKRLSSNMGGAYMCPNSFQLFSLGPNGVQDPDDAEESDDIVFPGQ
jgi:prepilin-type N-terminal cleavage/methylation domain-containing protein